MPRPAPPLAQFAASLAAVLAAVLAAAACGDGWNSPPVVDDDSSPADDDSPTPVDDDDSPTPDDDDSPTPDDDDSPTPDDDDSPTPDDDDASPTPDPDDLDGDGWDSVAAGGQDCDDGNPSIHPGAAEDPANGIDDNCDGALDEPLLVDSMSPVNGLAGGGSIVVLTGSGLTGVEDVTFGGAGGTDLFAAGDTYVEFVSPPGTPGDVDVVVSSPEQSVTLAAAFRYTGTASSLDSGWIEGGAEETLPLGVPSSTVAGVVVEPGVTDLAGEPAGILAEIGWGPFDWSPAAPPDSYYWFPAAWVADQDAGDRYEATVTPSTYGTFGIGFRFSDDGGYQWLYVDLDPLTALVASELPMLTVQP